MKLGDILERCSRFAGFLENERYTSLAIELCLEIEDPKEFEKKRINLIKEEFDKVKDKIKDRLSELKDDKPFGRMFLDSMNKCEKFIQNHRVEQLSEEFKDTLSKLHGEAKLAEKFPTEALEHTRTLYFLAQVEDIVCPVLKKLKEEFKDASLDEFKLRERLRELVTFAEELYKTLKEVRNGSYELHRHFIDVDIPKDSWVDCLFYLFELRKELKDLTTIDFLLTLSITSDVLKNEGLSTNELDNYVQMFKKLVTKVLNEIVTVKSQRYWSYGEYYGRLDNLRESLVTYLSCALRVSRTFNIDSDTSYHTYIVSKLPSIGVEDFREFVNLYERVVSNLSGKEYGRKYILPLLRLIALLLIRDKYKYMLHPALEPNLTILLEVIKFVNERCEEGAIENFDKILNHSIYFADLEFLDGFVDYLKTLLPQHDYERIENSLKNLSFY